MGCAPEGDGGDPVLNIRKNRDDEPAPGGAGYRDQSFESFIATPWPRTVDRRLTRNRSHSESAEIAAYEGAPVAVTGYITGLKQEGPESPNCRGGVNVQRDMHLWLTLAPDPDRSNAIVAEVTPRLRSRYPGWNPTAFRRLVKRRMLVRISGWMMLDPEHPDQLGKTRGTLWEIHPVMKIEVRTDSGWAIFE